MADPELELRQVRYFVAVAEERNFTRAAERLAMTQPALSRAVKALEKTVGAALLVRGPHGVTLTDAGRTLLTEGKALLAQAAQTAARVRRSATASSTVTVTSPGCDAVLLDRLVRSFNDACPPYRARASVGTVDDQLDRLRSGQADIALWRGPVPGPGFGSRLLFRERGHVLVGAGHRLAGRGSVTVADLTDEPVVRWLGTGTSSTSPALWPGGLPGRPGPQVSDGLQMLAVVRLGQAVAFTADPCHGAGRPEGTTSLPLADGPLVPLHLAWARGHTTEGMRRFLDHTAPQRAYAHPPPRARTPLSPARRGPAPSAP
ncbi:LysR family transcriptional regulator [Streptomyces leeuwenhoekii]|uniref:LysR family transcriptional regulator n=1 Tax=Streptomyces leeuwenhoekii TaxID=1437453 RepID=UPI0036FC0BD7